MISDPLTIENGATDFSAPRVVSPNFNTGKFRYEDTSGSTLSFEFIQNGNSQRSRHIARYVVVNAPDTNGVQESCTMTLTVDEPVNGAFDNDDLWYIFNTQFKGTLSETIFRKLLNGEV